MKQDILKFLQKLQQNQHLNTTPALLEAAPYKKIQTTNINSKISAVLLPIIFYENKWQLLMIIRPEYDGHHSGQIAFPGGKVEPQDKSTKETALRETFEEVGISPQNIQIINQLTEIYIPVSNYLIHPYVGITENFNHEKLVLDPLEVDNVIYIPIDWLLSAKLQKTQVTTSGNIKLNVPAFKFNNHIIWGASCMMLNELKFILSV
jgi:8-oxo-dGTP pyrophosphatase MutT (NUDIX family)